MEIKDPKRILNVVLPYKIKEKKFKHMYLNGILPLEVE